MKYIETTRPLFQLVDEAGNKLTDNQLIKSAKRLSRGSSMFENYLRGHTVLGDHNELAKRLMGEVEPDTPFAHYFIVRDLYGGIKLVGGYYDEVAKKTNGLFGCNVADMSIVAYELEGVKVELI